MKKLFKILLIILLALSSTQAKAFTLTQEYAKNSIAKLAVERYKQYTDAQLDIQVLAVPFRTTEIPNGKITFDIESNSNKFMARDLEKVSVFVNGKLAKKFNAPIQVKAYENVLVAKSVIPRERVIDSSVVSVEKREISEVMDYAVRADAINKELITKKFFSKGDIIDKRFLKSKPDIFRNSIVTVTFHTNNLNLSIDATALADGVIGDSICIMSKNYNKIYKGTVVGQNRVLVEI